MPGISRVSGYSRCGSPLPNHRFVTCGSQDAVPLWLPNRASHVRSKSRCVCMAQSYSIRAKIRYIPSPVCGCVEEVVLLLPQHKSHRNRHDDLSQHFSPVPRRSNVCGGSKSDVPILRL
jgi:hypothetical protein